ncbi:MAG TPA: D-alanyl-D-alanine carboxypeptidase family protein [Gaiellaceae bacterium]|nr:D-alanyl-D-alanine carboxypeptidase family protein [Gaiellaceae bacterium]
MRRLLLAAAVAAASVSLLAGNARAATPQVDARAWYLVNATNGEVLATHDARMRVPIASITKLMTVVVALQHLQPSDTVTVARRAAKVGESSIPLTAGQRISVRDLLAGALIQSANDAADALADAAAGGDQAQFVAWMNAEAAKLGLRDTHFVRPDGLDAPGHLSSARDVFVLARRAMRIPIVRQLVAKRTATLADGTVVHTWNDLLGIFPGLIGVKTGHTDDAGWCEVAAARRSGYTIYAVVLGSPTEVVRNDALRRLLAWGVSRYRTATLVRAGAYGAVALGYGRGSVPLVATTPLVRLVHADRPLVRRVVAAATASLPLRRGQRLGRVEVFQDGKLLGTRPLVAARSVARPGLGGRLRWYATRTVHDLLGLFP